VVFEDDLTCVFLAPASLGGMEGHALVITRRHVETIFDLTTEEAAALGPMVVRTAHAIRSVLNPDGILVEQRNGVAADQTVPHLHVHVIPRKDGVQYPPEQWVEVTPADQRVRLAQMLRARWPNPPVDTQVPL
jgi:histidine triad (HIT) family protein